MMPWICTSILILVCLTMYLHTLSLKRTISDLASNRPKADWGQEPTERFLTLGQPSGSNPMISQVQLKNEGRTKGAVEPSDSSDSRSRFLTEMTHELKTPLNAIAGFASLLLSSPEIQASERLTRQVRNIESGSEHMQMIVSDLLDFDKLECGVLDLAVSNVNIHDLIVETVRFLDPIAGQRDIHIEVEATPALPQISADVGRLRQIIVNLLSNSLKFTKDHDTVTVRLEHRTTGDGIQFTVVDHGPGLSSEDHERVFQKYFQTGTAESRRKGTGLGLPISRELARLHGGNIWAESAGVGKGCSFVCEIPLSPPTMVIKGVRAA